MRPKVYFTKINKFDENEFSKIAKKLLAKVVEEQKIKLNKKLPLKVHFGEHGNVTYVKPKVYDGMIDYLQEKKSEPFFLETNVLYKGRRTTRDDHLKLAKEHGFTKVPIVIADGIRGEAYNDIEINKKHFKVCKVGKEFENYNQMLVLSHFKGHMAAGFGGAIKQLAMGCAARGGKGEQHADTKPYIDSKTCIRCKKCKNECPVGAITISDKEQKIDQDICVGCLACTAVCPNGSVKKELWGHRGDLFVEKMTEYAYAANLGKKNIFINFAYDITKFCDCMGDKMDKVTGDVGIFASVDPVAIDQACFDKVKENSYVFDGERQLEYGEEIGLGSRKYDLVEVK